MGTNTSFIGNELPDDSAPRLKGYEGYKALSISALDGDNQYHFFGPHYTRVKRGAKTKDTAVCGIGADESQHHNMLECSCGFYCYTSMHRAEEHLQTYAGSGSGTAPGFALAKVVFSGTVIVCENGYRGEIQRVTHLYYGNCVKCDKNRGFVLASGRMGNYVPVCEECLNERLKNKPDMGGYSKLPFFKGKVTDLDYMTKEQAVEKLSVEGYAPIEIVFLTEEERQAMLSIGLTTEETPEESEGGSPHTLM